MTDQEKRVKKLLYRSWYRGCKETDKIIGGFAKKYISELSDAEIDELEAILDREDVDIYDWLSGKKPTPEDLKGNSVFMRLFEFKPYIETNN